MLCPVKRAFKKDLGKKNKTKKKDLGLGHISREGEELHLLGCGMQTLI